MASGRAHNTATLVLAGIAGGIAVFDGSGAFLWASGGVLAGLVLSPDLDVDGGNISLANMRKSGRFVGGRVIGWLAGKLWRLIWLPYALMVGHRSPWSHAPFLGTIVRLVYLGIWLAPATWLLARSRPEFSTWLFSLAARGLLYVYLGLAASDILHWIMDR
jgi:uncharacterized metal-binding protein